jgi:hypothetical protein
VEKNQGQKSAERESKRAKRAADRDAEELEESTQKGGYSLIRTGPIHRISII